MVTCDSRRKKEVPLSEIIGRSRKCTSQPARVIVNNHSLGWPFSLIASSCLRALAGCVSGPQGAGDRYAIGFIVCALLPRSAMSKGGDFGAGREEIVGVNVLVRR